MHRGANRPIELEKSHARLGGSGQGGSLAQSVEQRTFNPLVACSSHARPTSPINRECISFGLLAQLVEQRTLNPLVDSSNLSGPTKN